MASKENQEPSPSRGERSERDVRYHVYVRLPFKRSDFVDPPPVNWDESKSEALWGIISSVAKTEIDWTELAARFNVTVEFILQIASYLTERHTAQLRALMRKAATTKGSSAPSPVPGSESGPFPPSDGFRPGPAGGRAPSALSIRRDSPLPRTDGSGPGTPLKASLAIRPFASRNSSANTTTIIGPNQPGSKGLANPKAGESNRRRVGSLPISTVASGGADSSTAPDDADTETLSPGPASSAEDSDSSDSPVESRIIRRPPRFQPQDGAGSFADDDDDEAEPAFLPFTAQSSSAAGPSAADLGATLRGDPREFARRLGKAGAKDKTAQHSQTSDSSASSAAIVSKPGTEDRRGGALGPLSPRRTAELAGRSPGGKGKGYSRDGSDGTPSMGSSFSDLDDASVTQSAMEEALASKMQDGTIGSRMSTLGQAIRSRYLPTNNPNRQQ